MSTATWVLLALALALAPVPARDALRLAGLAASGRLGNPRASSGSRASRLVAQRLSASTLAALGIAAAIATATLRGGPALGLAAALGGGTAWRLLQGMLARRHSARRAAALSAAVQLLVAELKAGSSGATALRAAAQSLDPTSSVPTGSAPTDTAPAGAGHDRAGRDGPGSSAGAATRASRDSGPPGQGTAAGDAAALTRAAELLASGNSPAPALRHDPVLRPLALAWDVADHAGAPPAEVLSRVGDDFAATLAQRRTVHLALAGPRSSALLLAGLPLLGMFLGSAMGATPLAFLTGSPAGRIVCCLGVGLDAAGALWSEHLLSRAAGG